MESYQPGSSTHNPNYPGESVSGDSTVQVRDYRATSVEYFQNQDSGGGTVTSYATSGYKSEGDPNCDTDFDVKVADAYERIDVLQEKRRVVTHPNGPDTCPPPVQMRLPGTGDMPDYVTKKGWLSLKKCLCFFIILSLVTLFVAVAGAAIAIYAFLSVFEGGRIVGTTSTVVSSDATMSIEMLRNELTASIQELRSNVSVHANKFDDLSVQVASLLSPDDPVTTANNDAVTTDMPPTNTTENSTSVFGRCTTDRISFCPITRSRTPTTTNPGPSFIGCDTPEVSLERPGKMVMGIYCNVPATLQVNPITTNINIRSGEILCTCAVITDQQLMDAKEEFDCELYATYCPL